MLDGGEFIGWIIICVIVGALLLGIAVTFAIWDTNNYWSNEQNMVKVDEVLEEYIQAYDLLNQNFTIYNSTFGPSEPFIETLNVTEYSNALKEYKKSATLVDGFQVRYPGLGDLGKYYAGYFWFTFNDSGIEVQYRLVFKIEMEIRDSKQQGVTRNGLLEGPYLVPKNHFVAGHFGEPKRLFCFDYVNGVSSDVSPC